MLVITNYPLSSILCYLQLANFPLYLSSLLHDPEFQIVDTDSKKQQFFLASIPPSKRMKRSGSCVLYAVYIEMILWLQTYHILSHCPQILIW